MADLNLGAIVKLFKDRYGEWGPSIDTLFLLEIILRLHGQLPPQEDSEKEDREPPEPDGECFRGGEAAAYNAEQQAWIQRNLK